ncbi:MAG: peroxiredoxin-like family protein [Actinomycetota bacterium]|jgi:peroxiredoxin|nr:peroxiredoxin-like family protein [Actinomycetota bacterium]
MSSDLTTELKRYNESARERIPAPVLAVMDGATGSLRESGLVERSLAIGALAPDFVLPDANGHQVELSSLLNAGPVVLVFYRGGWCPYCSMELRALQARLGEITSAGATLVAVSPQTPDASMSTLEKLELSFPVLSDVGNEVARSYGLVFSLPEDLREVYSGFGLDLPAANGDDTFELPIPATYIIDSSGKVVWRFVDADYTKRADPDDVIAALASF